MAQFYGLVLDLVNTLNTESLHKLAVDIAEELAYREDSSRNELADTE